MNDSSPYRKIGVAAGIMMVSVFISRFMGLFREMSIAYLGGVGSAVDAYQIAFLIPEILNHTVATGFLSITFIPILSRYIHHGREGDGWAALSTILITVGAGLTLLIAAAWVWTPELLLGLAPGLKSKPQSVMATAVRLTRIILPAQLFFFCGGLFMAVQYVRERFLYPALASLVYNAGIIAGGWALSPWIGIEGFAWGVLIGAFFGNLVLQYIGAVRAGMRLRWRLQPTHPDLRRYVTLSIPLIIGLSATFSTEVFFRLFGSFLDDGTIAAINYALRLMMVLVGFFGQAVGTAVYPFMARLCSENRLGEMNDLLNTTLRHLSVVIPFAILVMVLRHEVVRIIFQRGRFDPAATALTADMLLFLMPGAFAFSAQSLVVRGYYATQNTWLPALISTISVVLALPFYLLGMQFLGARGVALAIAVSALIQVTALFVLWNRKSANRTAAAVYRAIFRMVAIGGLAGLLLEGLRRLLDLYIDSSGIGVAVLVVLVVGGGFLLLVPGLGHWANIAEIRFFNQKMAHLLRKQVTRG
jgi:putative peptidoglycan lipid II flippase